MPRTSRIANQSINRFGHLVLLQIFAEFVHTREGIQFAFNNVKVVHIEVVEFGDGFHFINIADGPDNMILIGSEEILHSLATKSRGAAGDDYQFCDDEHEHGSDMSYEAVSCQYKNNMVSSSDEEDDEVLTLVSKSFLRLGDLHFLIIRQYLGWLPIGHEFEAVGAPGQSDE